MVTFNDYKIASPPFFFIFDVFGDRIRPYLSRLTLCFKFLVRGHISFERVWCQRSINSFVSGPEEGFHILHRRLIGYDTPTTQEEMTFLPRLLNDFPGMFVYRLGPT